MPPLAVPLHVCLAGSPDQGSYIYIYIYVKYSLLNLRWCILETWSLLAKCQYSPMPHPLMRPASASYFAVRNTLVRRRWIYDHNRQGQHLPEQGFATHLDWLETIHTYSMVHLGDMIVVSEMEAQPNASSLVSYIGVNGGSVAQPHSSMYTSAAWTGLWYTHLNWLETINTYSMVHLGDMIVVSEIEVQPNASTSVGVRGGSNLQLTSRCGSSAAWTGLWHTSHKYTKKNIYICIHTNPHLWWFILMTWSYLAKVSYIPMPEMLSQQLLQPPALPLTS